MVSSGPRNESCQQARAVHVPPAHLGSPSGGRSWRGTGWPPPQLQPCLLPRVDLRPRHHTLAALSARRKWRAHPRSCRQTRTAEKCKCKWAREGITRVLDISTPQPWVAPPLSSTVVTLAMELDCVSVGYGMSHLRTFLLKV